MSAWDEVECEEGAQRARNVGWAVGAYLVGWVLLFLPMAASRSSQRGLALLAFSVVTVTWVWCLVASLRVLVHVRESRHYEGRGTALVGMFLTTGCVGLVVAMVLVPSPSV